MTKESFAMTGPDRRWLILPLLIVLCSVRAGAWQAACDRVCLTRIADAYFAAIAAHDSKKVQSQDLRD